MHWRRCSMLSTLDVSFAPASLCSTSRSRIQEVLAVGQKNQNLLMADLQSPEVIVLCLEMPKHSGNSDNGERVLVFFSCSTIGVFTSMKCFSLSSVVAP